MSSRPTTPDSPIQSRRTFVRLFALLTAGSVLGRNGWSGRVLADIRAQADTEGGLLRLNLRDFPALQQGLGSVRLGSSPVSSNHMSEGLFSPIIVNRAGPDLFYALEAACTHEGCIVPIFDPAARCMECPCHGSQYRIDGAVLRGPANLPLRQFITRWDGADRLTIELPDVSFALEALRVDRPGGRVRLDFIAFEQIDYEIRFRLGPQADWTGPVRFALTPSGPADQTMLRGGANIASVFVDAVGVSGFYAVVMRTKPV